MDSGPQLQQLCLFQLPSLFLQSSPSSSYSFADCFWTHTHPVQRRIMESENILTNPGQSGGPLGRPITRACSGLNCSANPFRVVRTGQGIATVHAAELYGGLRWPGWLVGRCVLEMDTKSAQNEIWFCAANGGLERHNGDYLSITAELPQISTQLPSATQAVV